MDTPKIPSLAVSDRRHLQVCKNPAKTRKRKEALSPAEAIDQRAGHLQTVSPLQPMNFGGMRAKPKLKAAPKRTPGDDNDSVSALPQVASTSTVLAPIGARTNYVGPALLRSRQLGLKRSGSSENCGDGNENLKRPRSGLSVRNGNGLGYFKIVSPRH